ncbi:peptide-binding protein [Caldimicrobium thiodismutans]|uniref:Peptide-binding protein n=1 Tax=Caldimicrobium thiodismutans TaxID=1653476 RepID=A0A0U4N0Z1_9BACT|nr:peptide-binding protein [Caldimicrobium thiodismutans]BAU22902.1 peptide-binding protein [Caldimicrobium thiodismutans]
MKNRKFLKVILIFLGFFLLLISYVFSKEATQSSKAPDYGDTLIIGTIADASILVPMLATDAMSHIVAGNILRGVVKYAPDLTIVGDLAERFEISKDQRVITFYLKKGVKWEDGVEVTAFDVEFGFKLITNPNIPSAYASDFLEVKEFKVLDKYTFRVTYKKPFALALSSWGNLVVLPKHLLEGKDLKYIQSVFGRRPVGNGPFRFEVWEPQTQIKLKFNPLNFEGRPYLDRIIYRVIPDPSTLFMELRSQGIDWISLTPLQYKKLQEETIKRDFQIYRYLAFAYTYIGYNLREPLFQDKRVRKALCFAIDKKKVVMGALLGQGIPAYGPYKPDAWFYNPAIEGSCSYNPEKALNLLSEAGFRKGRDGLLYKDGRPFEFTLLTNQGNLSRLLTAQIIQQELAKVGIRVNIRVMEWTTLIHQFIDKRRFQAVILGWTTGPDPDLYDIFHSSKIQSPGLNFIGYQNPEVDRLLEEGRYTLNREKRKKIYYRLQEVLAEDQPYTFLYIPMSLEAIHKRFRGIQPSSLGISYNIERWWVPKVEQKYLVP